jgi:predicted phage baseplate assembly protein
MLPNEKNPIVSEVASIEDLSDDSGTTVITLAIPEGKTTALSNVYELTSVNIYANIVLATHGETVNETLGSGDGSQINQQFTLRKPPLTYVSASTPRGGKSTLKVYVNDVQWQEVASFYGLTPSDQAYTVRIEDSGDTEIYFGDGKSAARLPSGSENITAIYRSGIGLAGAVTANKLTLLQKRPFGVKSVTNPMDASGAASLENIEDARVNAPSTVLTLGRIVSLKDYEDFARSFSGVGKAHVSVAWSAEEYIVHLIIASSDAKEVDVTSTLYQNLLNAINSVRAYGHKISLESFIPVYFNVLGKVYVDQRYLPEEVKANVQTALQNAFTFEKGNFGATVPSSDVIAVIQEVPGVLYTDIDRIYVMDQGQPDLTAFTVEPGMLLMINPNGINLEAIQ